MDVRRNQGATSAFAMLEQLASERLVFEHPIDEVERILRVAFGRSNIHHMPDVDVVGLPGPVDPAAYHLDALITCVKSKMSDATRDPTHAARRQYHARWLRYIGSNSDPIHQPLVTVVIPTYNSADLVVEAIESVLCQDYGKIELVVVDDGSQDDTVERLKSYSDRITLLRQQNSGCAVARNQGIRAASGDFVHFLDADDLLAPDAVSAKVLAFRQIADAEMCMSPYRCVGHNGIVNAARYVKTPLRGNDCPTKTLMYATVTRFAMSLCTAMAPRWVWLDAGPMDERLVAGSDFRHNFRLALRNTKLIGIDRELTTVRLTCGSLTTKKEQQLRFNGYARLLNLIDLINTPRWWPCVGPMLRMFWSRALAASLKDQSPQSVEIHAQLAAALQGVPDLAARCGLSAEPLLRVIHHWRWRRFDLRRLLRAASGVGVDQSPLDRTIQEADRQLWTDSNLPTDFNVANVAALRYIAKYDKSLQQATTNKCYRWLSQHTPRKSA